MQGSALRADQGHRPVAAPPCCLHLPRSNLSLRIDRPLGKHCSHDWLASTGIIPIGQSIDRKSTRLNSSHSCATRMPSSAGITTENTTHNKQTQTQQARGELLI